MDPSQPSLESESGSFACFLSCRDPPRGEEGQHEHYCFQSFTVPLYEIHSMLSPDVEFVVGYTSYLTMRRWEKDSEKSKRPHMSFLERINRGAFKIQSMVMLISAASTDLSLSVTLHNMKHTTL
jgi:hypothetical protein